MLPAAAVALVGGHFLLTSGRLLLLSLGGLCCCCGGGQDGALGRKRSAMVKTFYDECAAAPVAPCTSPSAYSCIRPWHIG